MKSKILIKGIASLMTVGMLAGCNSSYLQEDPVTLVSSATVQNTPEGAQMALYGLCGSMYTTYTDFQSNLQPNGEATLMAFYGDVMGQDYFSYFFCVRAPFIMTMDRFRNNQTWMCTIPWSYCYNLIAQANTILEGIDSIMDEREKMQFIKAQALTIRAHAYFRLLQLYAPRWKDSDNGNAMTVVIRTTPGTYEVPLSSMNAVLKLIYDDLDEAIAIYDNNKTNRKFVWEPDADVARGIYARTAMLRNDYKTAEKMAHDARGGYYKIMTAEEYKGGFAEPNDEWMWGNEPDLERTAYWSNGAWYACNGAYVDWNNGVGTINYELYRQMPETDIRRDLFFTPDKLKIGVLKATAFWNQNICSPSTMELSPKSAPMKNEYTKFGLSVIPEGGEAKWAKPYVSRLSGHADCSVYFGSQYKFWGLDGYGTDGWPFMRGAEMLLTEAEAACHNGNDQVARDLLMELNAQRNPQYSCSKSGTELLEEVKLQRRFELWGEGHNWFDMKRWNLPIVRNSWKAGDMKSNNIPAAYYLDFQPDAQGGWVWMIPLQETQYNSQIDLSQLQR